MPGRSTAADTLRLKSIAVSDVSLTRGTGADIGDVTLVIAESMVGAGDSGSIRLKKNLDEDFNRGVETIAFDDGTVWTRADLRVKLLAAASTSGNDTIVGFNTADTITPGAGDDTIATGFGNDIIEFGPSWGHDTIADFTPGAGSDDVIRFKGINGVKTFADVLAVAKEIGGDTVIAPDANTSLTLENVKLTALHGDDFSFI